MLYKVFQIAQMLFVGLFLYKIIPILLYYAFDLVPAYWNALVEHIKSGKIVVLDMVKSEIDKGEGTYLIWLDFGGQNLCDRELEDLIVNKAKLWLDSGSIFGKSGIGFQRINIATNRSLIKEALDRIKFALY